MRPLHRGFATLGVSALERCVESGSPWITLDEVGYLEARNEAYHAALCRLLEKKQVAAVIRKQDLPFLAQLRSREDVFLADLDAPFGNIGCVIMASGLGKRFGGNKLLADFHGRPLIRCVLDATDGIFSKRVVVTRHAEVAQLCESCGIQTRLHDLPHRSDTVRLGLEALGETDGCLFATADQPLLRKETVASLALAAVNGPERIWRTVWEDTPGSPVIFPKWAFPELRALPQGKGGSFLIQKYPQCLGTVSARDPYELRDIDSPQDLEELLTR
jgi:molybdenum cofactor cytidylyltransferase